MQGWNKRSFTALLKPTPVSTMSNLSCRRPSSSWRSQTGREREDPELASPVMAPDIRNRIGSLADIHLKLG
jgi:hypothetical protein